MSSRYQNFYFLKISNFNLAEHIQSHKKCYTAGWGTTSYGGSTSHKLQAVGLWIFDQDYCEETNNAGGLDDSMFCAGVPDFDNDGQTDGGKGEIASCTSSKLNPARRLSGRFWRTARL